MHKATHGSKNLRECKTPWCVFQDGSKGTTESTSHAHESQSAQKATRKLPKATQNGLASGLIETAKGTNGLCQGVRSSLLFSYFEWM